MSGRPLRDGPSHSSHRGAPGRARRRPRKARAAIDEQLTLIWNEAREQIRGRVNDATFRLWFERTVPVGLDEGAFVVGLPNEFARDWVNRASATPCVRPSAPSWPPTSTCAWWSTNAPRRWPWARGETAVGGGERPQVPPTVGEDVVPGVADGALNPRYVSTAR